MPCNRWCCIVIFITSLSVHVKSSGLYQAGDNVTILDANNIVPIITSSNTLWLVEYYLEWCGHCQDFAPTFKEFAHNISDWFLVVRVGVINCADDINSKFCTKQNITTVPTLKVYSPSSKVTNGDGETFASKRDVVFLRGNLIAEVEKNIDKVQWEYDRPKPDFEPVSYSYVMDFISKTRSTPVQYFVFVFEENFSSLGKEVMLDMSSCSNIIVRRILSDSDDGYTLRTKLRLRFEAPFVLVVASNGTFFNLQENPKTREEIVRHLRMLPDVVEIENKLINSLSSDFHQNSPFNIDYKAVKKDRVYLADIESGLRYMLAMEVSSHKVLTGSELEALKTIIKLFADVGSHFPARPSTTSFIKTLHKWIEPQSVIDGSDWLKRLNEKKSDSYLPATNKLWVGCLGSAAKLRGYPCSLWTIFHALSVATYKANLDKTLLSNAMHGYIANFFGCLECRNNFKSEISELPFKESNSPYDAVLWLWKMHNKVNKRLHSNSSSEDPAFPKVQFPPPSMCPRCWAKESQGILRPRSGEIARFLIRRFSPESVSWDYLDVAMDKNSVKKKFNPAHRETHPSRDNSPHFRSHVGRQPHMMGSEPVFFWLNGLDFSLCMLVWFVSAAAILLLIVAFHTRSRSLKQTKSSRHLL